MTIYSLDVLLFLFGNKSVVPCPVLTVASWPAYRFLKRQVRLDKEKIKRKKGKDEEGEGQRGRR